MKTRILTANAIAALLLLVAQASLPVTAQAQVPGIINYQGRIVDGGTNFNGTGQFRFALVSSDGSTNYWSNDGTAVGQPGLKVILTVTKGLYSVLLGDTTIPHMTVAVPASVFTNSAVLLRVWFDDGPNGFQQLTPDQRIAVAGYAFQAQNAYTAAFANSISPSSIVQGQQLNIGIGNTLGGSFAAIAGGQTNTASGAESTVGGGIGNTASGTASFVGGGGMDGLFVGGNMATGGGAVVGGGVSNIASNRAAVVSGGAVNTAGGTASFVGGGQNNTASGVGATVGGGDFNIASNVYATVGGGEGNAAGGFGSFVGGGGNDGSTFAGNTASGKASTVGGGVGNPASGAESMVGGGINNTASGTYATVGGGKLNTAFGNYATVPGGFDNFAIGSASLAAGSQAEAANDGAFVWADESGGGPFSSTGNNQFLIRAVGGVGINTNDPAGFALNVAGTIRCVSLSQSSDRNLKENFAPIDAREVLAKVVGLPITQWNFKTADQARHIGPMAQDFRQAFGLGIDNTTITTVDSEGVALAAIQGLYELVKEKDARIETQGKNIAVLDRENVELQKRLADLETRLQKVSEQVEQSKTPSLQATTVRDNGGL